MIKQDSYILIWMEDLGIKNTLNDNADVSFENLDLRVDSGEYIAISGIYGAARTNFINVVGCIKRPSSGKYIFDYNDITTIEPTKLDGIRSKHIGFLFKGLNIIDNLSVYKNIELPLLRDNSLDRSKCIMQAAQRLGLQGLLNKKARELSDFERHKLALARALVINPAIILADEPGEGLSKTDGAGIMDIIDEINKEGTAVLVFSDKLEVLGRTARHIVFDKGKVTKDSRYNSSNIKEGAI